MGSRGKEELVCIRIMYPTTSIHICWLPFCRSTCYAIRFHRLFLIQIELVQYVHLFTLSLITLPLMDVYRQNDGVTELIQPHLHLTLLLALAC